MRQQRKEAAEKETGQEAAEKETGQETTERRQGRRQQRRSVGKIRVGNHSQTKDQLVAHWEIRSSVPSSECCAADQSAQWWPWALD